MRKLNLVGPWTIMILAAMALTLAAALPTPTAAQSLPFSANQVVNVSVSFNSQVPLPDLSEETLAASQRAGRESLYRLARDECAVMKTVIAKSCRLTNINVSTQIQNYNNSNPVMLYINGNANFTISLIGDGTEDGQ